MGSPRGFKVFGKETRHGAGNTWKHDAIQFRTFARQMRWVGGGGAGYWVLLTSRNCCGIGYALYTRKYK
jgi:hypothetical protein